MVGTLGRQGGVVTAPERVICVTPAGLSTLTMRPCGRVAVRFHCSALAALSESACGIAPPGRRFSAA
jgi:hypothetical protein